MAIRLAVVTYTPGLAWAKPRRDRFRLLKVEDPGRTKNKKEGEPASNISYKAAIQSDAPQNEISELIDHAIRLKKYITRCRQA